MPIQDTNPQQTRIGRELSYLDEMYKISIGNIIFNGEKLNYFSLIWATKPRYPSYQSYYHTLESLGSVIRQ